MRVHSQCHGSGCLSPHYYCTSPMDYNSHHSLHYNTHIPIHHCTNHTAVTSHSLALIVLPHLHLIHSPTYKQHTCLHTLRSLVLAPADISERYSSCYLSLCLTPDCPTLELWTCACDLDPCLVLFTSLLCLWYSFYCLLTIACLILPLSNKYYCTWIHTPLTSLFRRLRQKWIQQWRWCFSAKGHVPLRTMLWIFSNWHTWLI